MCTPVRVLPDSGKVITMLKIYSRLYLVMCSEVIWYRKIRNRKDMMSGEGLVVSKKIKIGVDFWEKMEYTITSAQEHTKMAWKSYQKRLKITVDTNLWICYHNLVATTQSCERRSWSLKTEQCKVITSKEVNISQSAGFT